MGHLDEIQDTYDFTRLVMAGQWFVPRKDMHDYLGQSNAGLDPDLDALAACIATLAPGRPPRPPLGAGTLSEKGREIFFSKGTSCATCHPPPLYTDRPERTDKGTFVLGTPYGVLHDVVRRTPVGGTCPPGEAKRHQWLDTPSLIGLRRSEPYLHDGRAKTLKEIFTQFNPEDKHGQTSHLSEQDIQALVEFLKSLD